MNPQIVLLASIALAIAVFLFLREVFCWYYKINQRLEIEQQILDELRKLNAEKNIEEKQ